ncbi:hypothetical protein [Chthoniobacter flavus]|uniref:hypothetical protein n=1 Tax=Chthoniobacter flavus TaxID=191863 RepID=UPI00031B9695|nr:hypothetical protein [Chthoniobacter flavus]
MLPRIADWSWPFWNDPPQSVPIHLLTGKNDWRLSAWMLASWHHFSERTWPIFIHDDGTLPEEARELLKKLFPKARIIERSEADAAMEPVLRPFPFCADYRKMHPLALKLFDVPHFTSGERFMLFDSDLLFFNYPREILDWVDSDASDCWFNEDVKEGALITAAEARAELNIKIWSRVNSGLCLLPKAAIDFDLCDRALAQTSILSGHVWRVEQTLLMLCATRHNRGGLLPHTYEVSLGKRSAENAISRHYVGAVRDRFYAEGLKRLNAIFFPVEQKES